jgi:predicted DNA-binding transcriptional regulator AlpA
VSNRRDRPPARLKRGPSTSTRPEPSRPETLRAASREKLTLAEVCAELKISRSTFYDWRAKGRAPECIRLPNGDLRIRRGDLDDWLDACEENV